jgi:GNAT superfamily N-acetyltransferase
MTTILLTPEELLESRNQLLQDTLRKDFSDYPITLEYPLVLDRNERSHSFCIVESDVLNVKTVLAHINYWPRLLVSQKSQNQIPIGLIGNVATDEKARKRGYMSELLQFVDQKARQENCAAIFLWSDLEEFYFKQGFRSFGTEQRFVFTLEKLQFAFLNAIFQTIHHEDLTDKDLDRILSLRYPRPWRMKRTCEEFRALLSIPDTYLMALFVDTIPQAFLILGKGADLVGTVHEWGATHPKLILEGLKQILRTTELSTVTLLAPRSLSDDWQEWVETHAQSVSLHPMVLAKILDPLKINDVEQELFFWGLDGI